MSTTVVTVPCFSGAPWDLESLVPLAGRPLSTAPLPEGLDTIEAYADALEAGLDGEYVLVGDSFGAVIALALAVRRPAGLRGLVLSGGFAADPVTTPLARARVAAARLMPRAAYHAVTLRFHADALASPHDGTGQVPWTRADSRRLFLEHTPHGSYVARTRAAFDADYLAQLGQIGPAAAALLLAGIPDAREVVLPRTGHMFRFSHPHTYAQNVEDFLLACVPDPVAA